MPLEGGFQNKGQAAFCLGVVGSGHTCKVYTLQEVRHFRLLNLREFKTFLW